MTYFRNVKLKVLSREHSAAFQEAAFETGARWVCGQDYVRLTNASFLYITETGEIVCSDNELLFEKSECEEIWFTTPAYLKTKIQIRNKEHLDFVLEKLRQNGVQGLWVVKSLLVRSGDYMAIGKDGFMYPVEKEQAIHLDAYKEIFIEKDDAEPDDTTTKTIGKLVVDVEADITTRFLGTETSDGSTASYYELPDGATELQHLISHKNMNAQIGEIFRSCYRYGQASHSDQLRDAKKIQFYINAEIERLEKLNAK